MYNTAVYNEVAYNTVAGVERYEITCYENIELSDWLSFKPQRSEEWFDE